MKRIRHIFIIILFINHIIRIYSLAEISVCVASDCLVAFQTHFSAGTASSSGCLLCRTHVALMFQNLG